MINHINGILVVIQITLKNSQSSFLLLKNRFENLIFCLISSGEQAYGRLIMPNLGIEIFFQVN